MSDKLREALDQITAIVKARKEKRELKENTVINLSNPQPGDAITFLLNETWIIEFVIILSGKTKFNRAILFLKKPRGTRLYSVPQRLNGNLERKTLRRVPTDYVGLLKSTPNIQKNLPAEIIYIAAHSDIDASIKSIDNSNRWSLEVEVDSDNESTNYLIERIKWAILLQGANFDGPFEMFSVSGQDEVLDDEGYPIYSDDEPTRSSIRTVVWFDPIEASPEPDATLLDHIPPRLPSVKIDPNDLEKTVSILKKHFDLNDLIDALKR